MRSRIIGIDFSGAKDASKKIWLAEGSVKGNALEIERCSIARDLCDPGNDRTACYNTLRAYLARQSDAIVGLDFSVRITCEDFQAIVLGEILGRFYAQIPPAGIISLLL